MTNAPNTGIGRRLTLDGERWFIVVTDGPDGLAVDATIPGEDAPENTRTRRMVETICANINDMIAEVRNGRGHAALD